MRGYIVNVLVFQQAILKACQVTWLISLLLLLLPGTTGNDIMAGV